MDTQENIYPKTDCVALAVRKEHRLMVINKVKKYKNFFKNFILCYIHNSS